MEIKQLDEYREFDVFLGKGWNNWIRVKYSPQGCSVVKSSSSPSSEALDLIFYKIKRKFFQKPKKPNE